MTLLQTTRGLATLALMLASVSYQLGVAATSASPGTAAATAAAAASTGSISPRRAEIVDRNGVLLATSDNAPSLFANPRRVKDPGSTADLLARLIPGTNAPDLRAKLVEPRTFVWIARRVDEPVAQAVMRQSLAGIGLHREPRRRYPQGALTSHVVGYTDADVTAGMGGAERWFNRQLADGKSPLALSIDIRLQTVVLEELRHAVERSKALGGAGLLLNPGGEVLALVSLPDFDPQARDSISPNGDKDKLTGNVYELGGAFAIFTAAIALEGRVVTTRTSIDVSRPLRLGQTLIRDDDPVTHPLSASEVFARSSVIGLALIAERTAPETQFAMLRKFGLIEPMSFVPGEPLITPLVRQHDWRDLDRTVLGYGYGLAITPLQATAVASSIVNQGLWVQPRLLNESGRARTEPHSVDGAPRRVVSEQTSTEVRKLLRAAVTDGTGLQADVSGYAVGGKTGSTYKHLAGKYDKTHRETWFIGAFPLRPDTASYTLLVMLDEPQVVAGGHDSATAQWNAAPAAGRIIARAAPLLNLSAAGEGTMGNGNHRSLIAAASATGAER
jgi:cell division protein FtsI (penicillin-binding protein 3)